MADGPVARQSARISCSASPAGTVVLIALPVPSKQHGSFVTKATLAARTKTSAFRRNNEIRTNMLKDTNVIRGKEDH
jgi:hypothetical protein